MAFYFMQRRGGEMCEQASCLLSEPDACLRSPDPPERERQTKSMKLSSNLHTHGTAQENTYSLTHTTVINKIIFKIETITNDEKDIEHFEASGVTGHDRT